MNDQLEVLQPMMAPITPPNAVVAREVQEVQGAIISARMYPRDYGKALKRIEDICQRVQMAERAMYSYPRGGQTVTGPSIRLAEVIAQQWGNLDTGWKVVARHIDSSELVAWAWDLETNTRKRIEFTVDHIRETKKEVKKLTDSRDIYELCANQASRRQRNCILAVVPSEIADAAVEMCEKTLENAGKIEERRAKMVAAFKELDVSQEQLERRFGKKIAATTATELVQAQKIYQSLRDGMSKSEDWFESILDPKKITNLMAEDVKVSNKESHDKNHQAMVKILREEISKKMLAKPDANILGGLGFTEAKSLADIQFENFPKQTIDSLAGVLRTL